MTYDPTLYPKYLARAQAAFAARDAQRQQQRSPQRPIYDNPVANHLLSLLLDALHHAPRTAVKP